MEALLPPRRSLSGGLAAGVVGATVAAITAALVTQAQLPLLYQLLTLVVGLAITTAVGMGARALFRGSGGLYLERGGRGLGFGLTGPEDTWWVPLDRLLGVRCAAAPGPEIVAPEDASWLLLVCVREGPEVVVLETHDRTQASEAAAGLARATNAPLLAGPAERGDDPRRGAEIAFAVQRGVALTGTVLAMGVCMAVVGAALFAQVAAAPVFGFLFGPLLMVLGLALVVIVAAKRLGHEVLEHRDGAWSHRYVLGRLSWGRRVVRVASPAFRLRPAGAKGAHLECVGEDGTLVMASGANTRSSQSIEEISRIPRCFD